MSITRNWNNTWAKDNDYYKEDRHRCFAKIRAIIERTGIRMSHDEVSYLCEALWQSHNASEFNRRMNGMSNEELGKWANDAKEGVKSKTKDKIKKRTGVELTPEELSLLYDQLQQENTKDVDGVPFWEGMYSDVEKMDDEKLRERLKRIQEEAKRREEIRKRMRGRALQDAERVSAYQ